MVVALVWLVVGVLLAAAEALTGHFVLLMLGGAAMITAGVSAVANPAGWVDGVVFGIAALALLFLLRPLMLRRFAPPAVLTGIAALPGKTALVLEEITEHAGRVKLDGEVWTARPFDDTEVYAPGTKVTVMKIDGAIAVVWKGP